MADYNEAIRIDPRFAVAYRNRGILYLNKGDNNHAIADCDEAIRIDPKYAVSYDNRADA